MANVHEMDRVHGYVNMALAVNMGNFGRVSRPCQATG